MLDMLKDKNLLIGAAIGVGASYAMKGSGKGTLPRAALYGVIGAAAGKMILPKVLGAPAAAAAPAAPEQPSGLIGEGDTYEDVSYEPLDAQTIRRLERNAALTEKRFRLEESGADPERLERMRSRSADRLKKQQAAAEGMYVGRIRRHY